MTHLDLLNKLPSPIREQAIENCRLHLSEEWLLEAEHEALAQVLYHGFPWVNAPNSQGESMWAYIYGQALAGEFDDPSVSLPREDWEALKKALEYVWVTDTQHTQLPRIKKAIQSQLTK